MAGLKIFIESLVLLMAWVLVIYCQDFWSFLVFLALCVYTCTINRKRANSKSKSLNAVLIVSVVTLVIVYALTLTNLSSNNSPQFIPLPLLTFNSESTTDPNDGVYPSKNKLINFVPLSMTFQCTFNSTMECPNGIQEEPVSNPAIVNIDISNYCGLYWTLDKLYARIWIILVMWMLLFIYFKWFKLWVLFERLEIIQSKTLNQKI